MIRRLSSLEEHRAFIEGFIADPLCSDPHFAHDPNNLWRALEKKDQAVLGVFRQDQIIGLFVLLILEDEQYAEMIIGLSRERAAYEEMLQFITENCRGFSVDFVLSPRNRLLRDLLQQQSAAFDAPQHTMAWVHEIAIPRKYHIELLSEPYEAQYLAMHSKNVYWTGERVLAAADRFRVLAAVQDGELVGYLDITHCYAVNEPYDLRVKDRFEGQGYEQALLSAAIEYNKPKGLTVLVDEDDTAGIAIFQAVGFERLPHRDSLTVHLNIQDH